MPLHDVQGQGPRLRVVLGHGPHAALLSGAASCTPRVVYSLPVPALGVPVMVALGRLQCMAHKVRRPSPWTTVPSLTKTSKLTGWRVQECLKEGGPEPAHATKQAAKGEAKAAEAARTWRQAAAGMKRARLGAPDERQQGTGNDKEP